MSNNEKSGIKILAADAKARLKNGYYSKENNQPPKSYHEIVMSSFAEKEISRKDKLFYDKVKEILSEGEVINPIQRLVDQKYLESLSYSAKQRYLLEIAEKFNKIKN
jgi:hypothetical protein